MISAKNISVVIVTRNRPNDLITCLQSLKKSSVKDFELVLIDQSDIAIKNRIEPFLSFPRVQYFHLESKGLSIGRNFAIRRAKGNIICFTDDDCIVDSHWISNIVKSFQKHNNIHVIFGSILPYKPEHHEGERCPCTFVHGGEKIISKPCVHYEEIGSGNNMAFKKNIFYTYGFFKEWLGLNSIGRSAEDAEIALRLLIKREKILTTNTVIVYHNRWLSQTDLNKLFLSYDYGMISCYGYFLSQGYEFGNKVMQYNRNTLSQSFHTALVQLIGMHPKGVVLLFSAIQELFNKTKSLLVGYYYGYTDRLSG